MKLEEAKQLQTLARQVIIDNGGHDIRFKPVKKVNGNERTKQSKSRKK